MNHDQADELRQLVRASSGLHSAGGPAAPLVVIGGGKGGVGTTTIAVNLAVALARQGRRAVFVDADLDHGGNSQLSQNSEGGSVIDVLAGRRDVHEVLQRGPSGIQVLSGTWASGESIEFPAAAQDRFVADLERLAPHAEVVVVDAGSSRGAFARRLWDAASAVVAVTTTDDTSLMQCYAAVKVLAAGGAQAPVHVLVNLANDARSAADVHARISEACRRFLGIAAATAGRVAPCHAPSDAEPVLVFPGRGESARSMDRVADTLWAQLQRDSAGATRRRRAATAASPC
jgi:flagellar biosynthesis protein FlhG